MARLGLVLCLLLAALSLPVRAAKPPTGYDNFKVAVYARAQEVREMGDRRWLEPRWERISRDLHVDHIYLESHRDMILVDNATLEKAKAFFRERGVKVSGGITW